MKLIAGLQKFGRLLRQQGVLAAVRKVGNRFVFSSWVSVVYRFEGVPVASQAPWPVAGYGFRWYDTAAALTPGELESLRQQGHADSLQSMGAADSLFVVWKGDVPACFGLVMSRGPQFDVLGLEDRARLIGHCETHVEHRGLGLYTHALVRCVSILSEAGTRGIYVESREDNAHSIRGIERAGFSRLKRVDAAVWAGSFVRSDGAWRRVRREH